MVSPIFNRSQLHKYVEIAVLSISILEIDLIWYLNQCTRLYQLNIGSMGLFAVFNKMSGAQRNEAHFFLAALHSRLISTFILA